MKNVKTKELVYLSLFISMEVILTRFLSIQTPVIRISFTFIPIAVSAILFGPMLSGICAGLADIIGMLLFPLGTYFPGFTLTAFLSGVIYGVFLHDKNINIFRIIAAVIIVSIFINLGLDTIWLWMITGKGIMAILPTRLAKCLIIIPIQAITIEIIWRLVVCPMSVFYDGTRRINK